MPEKLTVQDGNYKFAKKIKMYINRKMLNFALFLVGTAYFLLTGSCRQGRDSFGKLEVMGTRSWIRVNWEGDTVAPYHIYWAEKNERPQQPNTQLKGNRFYIQNVKENTCYYVWVMPEGRPESILTDSVITVKDWRLEKESREALYPASSAAVPEGMELYWHDEFNDALLNRNKWSTNYYSNWDFMDRTNWEEFRRNDLPQPALFFTDTTLRLVTNDRYPERTYWKSSGRKISSIQTFDWYSGENYLDNSRGGYFEVRVRRQARDAEMVNTAFWFDSPGPDLKYYLEAGDKQFEVTGIRPHGQVFEIDVFEYLNAEIVLHGNVSPKGEFQGNIGHFIIKDERFENEWVTHGMLWMPSGLYFYVNGKLKASWTDPRNIKSPDHFMNVFLGAYGKGGEVEMETDYIRYYQWPVVEGNELPNAGFEYGERIFPWEGQGKITDEDVRSGKRALLLNAGDTLLQYVYACPGKKYDLSFWYKGNTELRAEIARLKPVTGEVLDKSLKDATASAAYRQEQLQIVSPEGRKGHMNTLKLTFINKGRQAVVLDDVELRQALLEQ